MVEQNNGIASADTDTTAEGAATKGLRQIRSFVRREGRLTSGQERALAELFPQFGLTCAQGLCDWPAVFGNTNPVVLELGFGNGASLLQQAMNEPHLNFVGIEVHRPGVGALLLGVEQHALANIRVFCDDAVEVVRDCIPLASLQRIQVYFPDPWHKKRHHKRRLIQSMFVETLVDRLQPGGLLHLATDWENYAEHMAEVLEANSRIASQGHAPYVEERPSWRPQTKFETRGERLGHGVWDLVYRRKP